MAYNSLQKLMCSCSFLYSAQSNMKYNFMEGTKTLTFLFDCNTELCLILSKSYNFHMFLRFLRLYSCSATVLEFFNYVVTVHVRERSKTVL